MAATGSGVSCIYMNRDMERNNLKMNSRFKNLHKFDTGLAAQCTGLSVFEDSVATVGEDGRIVVLSVNNQKILLELEDVDAISPTAVKFITYKELLTGNRMGSMYLFDLRVGKKEPTATLMVSCEDEKKLNSVTAIANHPTQKHIVSCLYQFKTAHINIFNIAGSRRNRRGFDHSLRFAISQLSSFLSLRS